MIEMLSSRLKNITNTQALTFLLDNIYIRFGTKLYRQIVVILMGTYYAPLVADLCLFCSERDFMLSLSGDKDAAVIEVFNSTSRYLDDNTHFDNMVNQIYLSKLQLKKAKSSDTEAPFLNLHLTISDGFVLINLMTLILILYIFHS